MGGGHSKTDPQNVLGSSSTMWYQAFGASREITIRIKGNSFTHKVPANSVYRCPDIHAVFSQPYTGNVVNNQWIEISKINITNSKSVMFPGHCIS